MEWEAIFEELKKDFGRISYKELMLKAVSMDGRLLILASEELRNDREVILRAVQNDTTAIDFASETLLNDQ